MADARGGAQVSWTPEKLPPRPTPSVIASGAAQRQARGNREAHRRTRRVALGVVKGDNGCRCRYDADRQAGLATRYARRSPRSGRLRLRERL